MALPVLIILAGSVVGTTSVVLVNKALAVNWGFKFALTLTGFHLLVSWLIMVITSFMGGFKQSLTLTNTRYIIMALSAAGSIVLTNFSLVFNSIGVYQVLKLANIPVIMLFQFIWFRRKFNSQVLAATAVLVTGVGICTVDFNLTGLLFGIAGMVATAVNQAASQDSQQRLKVTSAQLLRETLGLQAFLTITCALIFEVLLIQRDWDDPKTLTGHDFKSIEIFCIVISAFLGLMSNWFGQSLIGKTSAVTYQVVGHLKTLFTVVLGLLFFSRHVPVGGLMRQGIGLILAWGGGIWYSRVKDDGVSDRTSKLWLSKILSPRILWSLLFVTAFAFSIGTTFLMVGYMESDNILETGNREPDDRAVEGIYTLSNYLDILAGNR